MDDRFAHPQDGNQFSEGPGSFKIMSRALRMISGVLVDFSLTCTFLAGVEDPSRTVLRLHISSQRRIPSILGIQSIL